MFRILCCCLLFISQTSLAQSLLILGDSLSAGYQMESTQSWPHLLESILAKKTPIKKVINASISGDTTGNGLSRLPNLLEKHKPNWILIELGANDGLRGFSLKIIETNIKNLITVSKKYNAKPMLMQIQIPPNYGKRYSQGFYDLFQKISQKSNVPLLPFFMEKVVLTKEWMMQDGLHPTANAQPWIADFVAKAMEKHLFDLHESDIKLIPAK